MSVRVVLVGQGEVKEVLAVLVEVRVVLVERRKVKEVQVAQINEKSL